mmetsp:Transcript_12341/g.18411  ORF Transcript_12341/g.18411 Transcript_12341/m.18411 type:complete len:256 (+) Transcript_12341:3-770(+)
MMAGRLATSSLRSRFWRWTTQARPSWRKSPKEAAILFVVFGITGSTSVAIVRPALKHTIGLEGSLKDGPWSYRIGSLVLVSPVYACILLSVGTLAGRHAFAAKMFQKIMGRFLPASVTARITCAPTRVMSTHRSSLRAPDSSSVEPTDPIAIEILETVKSTPVVMFATATCPFCRAASETLSEEGIPFETKFVDSSAERMALGELTGQTSVPSIWIGGKFVGGYGDGPEEWMGLMKLMKAGTLHDMVDEAVKNQA